MGLKEKIAKALYDHMYVGRLTVPDWSSTFESEQEMFIRKAEAILPIIEQEVKERVVGLLNQALKQQETK